MQMLKAVWLSAFRIELQIVGNAIFCQKRVKGYAFDFDGMALHPVSAGSGAIERAKYVSFIINPKGNFPRLLDIPNTSNKNWSRSVFFLKPASPALHEIRFGSICHP